MSAKKNYLVSRFILILMVFVLCTSSIVVPAPQKDSYIVQGDDLSTVVAKVEEFGGVITSELKIINGVAAHLDPDAATLLSYQPGIYSVTPNAQVSGSTLPESNKKNNPASVDAPEVVGADYIWEQGFTGEGVTIAIVDSGISNFNPLKRDTNNDKRIVAWKDFVDNKKNPVDQHGHGTHLASIMVNSEEGEDQSYNGIAPDANLVIVRVLDETGYGDYETVISGIDWVLQHREEYNIRVLNLSLSGEVVAPYWEDPLNRAVTRAWAEGLTVITCAGNQGPDPMTISVPGNNPYVITVGAFTDAYTPNDWSDDYLAEFSSAGPTHDAFIKPDLIAPGAHMLGLMNNSSYISKNHQANRVGSNYFEMSGSSQASAVVSGIVALMYQQNPGLTPDEVKYRLMMTSMPMIEGDVDPEFAKANYSIFQQGAGRVNAPDAVLATEGVEGTANNGMDIQKDLNNEEHYQGYAYYDEQNGLFGVSGADESIDDGYTVWDGGFGIWSGGFGIWSGGFGIWSGGFGIWSGGFGIWSGGFGIWSGGFGIWSGGFGIWSGGFGIWSGGFGIWSGNCVSCDELPDDQNKSKKQKVHTGKWIDD